MRSHNHKMTGRVAREQRQIDAAARQQARASRTPSEQIKVLHKRLGADYGAFRETDRLLLEQVKEAGR